MVSRILRILRLGASNRQVLVLASGHVAGYAVVLLFLPILSRLYDPADFGVLAAYTAALSLLGVVGTMQYQAAIPLPSKDRTAVSLMALSLGGAFMLSVVIGAGSLALRNISLAKVGMDEIRPYLGILAVSVMAHSCFQILTFWTVRRSNFHSLARMRFTFSVSSSITQAIIGSLLAGPFGLLFGHFIGYLVAVIAVLVAIRADWSVMGHWTGKELRGTGWRYRNFPFFAAPSELVLNLTAALPPLLLAALYELEVVGWFMLAWRAVGSPLTVLVVPVNRVYLAAASQAVQRNLQDLGPLFRHTLAKILLVGTPPVVVLGIIAPWLFAIIFGERWVESGHYCRMLCPMLLCHLAYVSLRPTYDVLNRQAMHLLVSIVGVILLTVGILVPHRFGASPVTAVGILSLSGSIGYLLALALAWLLLPKFSPHDDSRPATQREEVCAIITGDGAAFQDGA